MDSKYLSKALHRGEKWVQNRLIIQDFCIPEDNASSFLTEMIENPAVFPIWLLPIKGTHDPQIFAPHLLNEENGKGYFINIGMYGLPSYSGCIGDITKRLEKRAREYGGRKVLYSRTYYTQDEFWKIYSKDQYQTLREKTGAVGVFRDISEKVLSI